MRGLSIYKFSLQDIKIVAIAVWSNLQQVNHKPNFDFDDALLGSETNSRHQKTWVFQTYFYGANP